MSDDLFSRAPAPPAAPSPKLRVVPPACGSFPPAPPAERQDEDVSIEPTDDGRFWLSFVRDDGTTRGALLVTRTQLEKLMRRVPAALEMTEVGR